MAIADWCALHSDCASLEVGPRQAANRMHRHRMMDISPAPGCDAGHVPLKAMQEANTDPHFDGRLRGAR